MQKKITVAILVIALIGCGSNQTKPDNSVISLSGNVHENDLLKEMVGLAHITSKCSIIKQLVSFQPSDQSKEIQEFLSNFIDSEVEKLGTTAPNFANKCNYSLKRYLKIREELNYNP